MKIWSLSLVGLSTGSSLWVCWFSLCYFRYFIVLFYVSSTDLPDFPFECIFFWESFVREISDIDPLFQWSERLAKMYLQFYINENGDKVYTAKVWHTDWFHSSRLYNSGCCLLVGVFYEVLYIYRLLWYLGHLSSWVCIWVCEHMCAIVDISPLQSSSI